MLQDWKTGQKWRLNRGNMLFWDAMLEAANRRGLAMTTICTYNGWSKGYIAANKSRNSMPKIDNAIRMFDACNYKLCAIPDDNLPDDAIVIDNDDDV